MGFAFVCLLSWACIFQMYCWVLGQSLCKKLVLLFVGAGTVGQVPHSHLLVRQVAFTATGETEDKRKSRFMCSFQISVFTVRAVAAILPPHTHTLTNFLKVRHHCLTEAGFLTDTVQHAAGTQLEVLLLTSVRSASGPWGVLQYGLSYGLKRREKKKIFLSPGKAATHVLMIDTF